MSYRTIIFRSVVVVVATTIVTIELYSSFHFIPFVKTKKGIYLF